MRENALGPVSIRRYITPILILLSVTDGSIFLLSFRSNRNLISMLIIGLCIGWGVFLFLVTTTAEPSEQVVK